MKVLHVVSSVDARGGGPVEALRGLVEAQVDAGLRAGVLTTWKQGESLELLDRLRGRGVEAVAIGPTWRPLGRHPALSGAMTEAVRAADVVHVHGLWEEVQHQAAGAAWRCGRPYIIRPCGMLDPWSLNQSRWKKRLYLWWRLRGHLNRATRLHFTTATERDLTAPLNLRAAAIVEPNGISVGEFARLPARGGFRERHGIDRDQPVVLFLSRLHPKKGLDLLLPALAQVPGAMLVLAGPVEETYRSELQAQVEQLGLRERVRFVGMLRGDDKLAAFVDADLFALPSYQENFGVAVVEALAAGLPVVVSDQVNIHDEVTRGGVGAVVPTRVEPLAVALRDWLGDEPRRRAAGEAARALARERYAWDQIARRWKDHYAHLTASPGTRATTE